MQENQSKTIKVYELRKQDSVLLPYKKCFFVYYGYFIECFNGQWLRFIGPGGVIETSDLPYITYLGIAKENKIIEVSAASLAKPTNSRETIDIIAQNFYIRQFCAMERLIILWKDIGEDIGRLNIRDCIVPKVVTQSNIATCLGVSREYLNNMQKNLTKDNMIAREDGQIILKDWNNWCDAYQNILKKYSIDGTGEIK
ncbi:Crp/Fnr family transcriptional regulator [Listeria weihenstephanensis]|uniref:Crp/Fnr family transcriptional regulator n=1 Tax=Listeria weihenstephanensis TaxID=1006155 RepID=A0A841ZBL8_9LIST|nr:Crp/Fnr family transcriptional regulator [Listeria weihenstephanensis]MBC1501877.1 Crp/Fnr family transcriptional regulator [Listeria weihenstephanensis]